MEKKKNLLYFVKVLISIVLFSAALFFENCQQQRFIAMIIIFALYLAVGFLRFAIKKDSRIFLISFLADIALIYLLEHNSRLLLNYFFHTFYIIILLEASMSLSVRNGIILGSASVLVSMVKYIYLIYYKFNLSSVSEMAFFLMINALILIVAGFAQHNKEEREKKDILYRELLDVHKKLKEYTDEVKRLSIVEERNRIAREIHDSLGHSMTALIMQLQMAEHYMGEDSGKSKELLANSVITAKNSLTGIREVVETLRGYDAVNLSQEAIKKLIQEFSQKTGAEIKLTVTGEQDIKNSGAIADLYRIVQESMTNSIRHGNASKIDVTINYTRNSISFSIKDNGSGALDIHEGFGLKGIRERAKAFNGNVEYESADGFTVKGILHLEEKHDKSDAC